MQFSSNSDAALAALIRANPTPAGRYRQAAMHLRDRLQALQAHERNERRAELRIAGLRLEQQRLQCELGSEIEREIARNKSDLIELDIEEGEAEVRLSRDLVADARREADVCVSEIEAIRAETGLDFENMPAVVFQVHMHDEFRQKRIRWLAAGYLGPRLGIPIDRMEALLEYSPEERAALFAAISGLASENEVVMQHYLESHAE
jgi:hypothetical protein